jgi:dihydrolipoamide dehydrogenase
MAKRITILGGGPAGYVAAIRATQLGADVTLVEKDSLGGVCTNRGCIPTKTYFHYAEALHDLHNAAKDKVFEGEISHDWLRMLRKKDTVVKRLVKGIEYLMKTNGIRVADGIGKISGVGTVEVVAKDGSSEKIEHDNLLIATGSVPRVLPIDGWSGSGVWDSTDALNTEKMPSSMIIIGGGVIGCEFAHIFATFGCKVTIIEVMENILPGFDPDIVAVITKVLAAEGVALRTGIAINKIERTAEGVVAYAGGERFEAEEILAAVGRTPTPPEGIETAGVKIERGAIVIDSKLSAGEGIYAAGDVCGDPFLAHWASAMGEIAVENMLGAGKNIDNHAIPGATFTALEIGTVGLTEPQAKEKFDEVKIGMFPYQASGRAKTASAVEGFAKVIATGDDVIVGIHIAGRGASEMLTAASLSVTNRLKIDDWRNTIIAHPTFGEILKESALDALGEALHK